MFDEVMAGIAIDLSETTEPAAAGVRLPDHHTLHTQSLNQRGQLTAS